MNTFKRKGHDPTTANPATVAQPTESRGIGPNRAADRPYTNVTISLAAKLI